MNSNSSRKKELTQAIQSLRSTYKNLEEEIPFDSLEKEDLAVHPESEYLLGLLKEIFLVTRNLTRITNELISIENKFMIVLSDEDKQFLDDIAYPRFNTIKKAIFAYHPDRWWLRLLEPSTEDPPDESDRTIFHTILAALNYWDFTIEEEDDRRYDDFAFSDAFDVVNSSLFRPDEWKKNSDVLKPVSKAIQAIRDTHFPALIPKQVNCHHNYREKGSLSR